MKTTSYDITDKSHRNAVLQYAAVQYGTTPEYPWMKLPGYAVLRHSDNQKWYGIIMNVQREKPGLSGSGYVDILDIKCDPIMGGSLLYEKGILPAYHMHKGNWITILLDGSVEKDFVLSLLDMSFHITEKRQSVGKLQRTENREWIVPANPEYYDLEKAFSESDIILWKQSNHIIVGDTIYLYVAAPISAILYKCQAVEVDIPYQYYDTKVHMSRVMKIKLLHTFGQEQFNFETLKEYGIYAVRGPRSVPDSLRYAINAICSGAKEK